ncbi:MAG: sodium:solute symporter [Melioribacteraceae bacterium]|nr:sodium:solute symporter [Melioribacteraceae bacterium]MCF8265910.1 sodium:solute symporter [Melioribacteraceae bacterium]MCF8412942.1 sodium:solute symporter [Melioribacteraceae bacterium]
MEHYSFWSVLPPLIAIIIAIKTRQVFISLLVGTWFGVLVTNEWNIILSIFGTISVFVNVFSDAGNTRIIIFSLLVGVLISLIQKSGGVRGFNNSISSLLSNYESKHRSDPKKIVQLMAVASGMFLFIETNISVLTTGTLFRPIFDKLKISREKLAYLVDSTCAPSCVLVPFNAWGAFIIGLLALQNLDNPLSLLLLSIPFNFYALLTILFLLWIIISGKDFGAMKFAELRVLKTGKLLNDGSTPSISNDLISENLSDNIDPKIKSMLIPIITTVLFMPIVLFYTGFAEIDVHSFHSTKELIFESLKNSSGSTSVLVSVIIGISSGMLYYTRKKIFKPFDYNEIFMKGMSGMLPLALLMVFAFAIGDTANKLGTGIYLAEVSQNFITPQLLPAILFLTSAIISFSTGTSWGTFAIMIAIGIPMAQSLDANLSLSIASVLSGGVFGDHCSPISDTTIVSSMASATDHIDHVKTQLPYALFTGTISLFLFLLFGYFI